MKDYISIKLDNPLKVAINKAGKNTTDELNLVFAKCWNLKEHRNSTLSLRNQFKRIILNISKELGDNKGNKQEVVEQKSMTAEDISQFLGMAEPDSLIKFYQEFREFLVNNILFKDEELKQKLYFNDLDKLDISDEERIISEYIEFFFVAAWKM
jgi:hypothetical protein